MHSENHYFYNDFAQKLPHPNSPGPKQDSMNRAGFLQHCYKNFYDLKINGT